MMRSIFYLFLLLGVSSCGNDVYFEQNQELSPKLQWQKFDKKTFNVKVDDLASKFQMKLNFRYIEGFSHKTFKVKVTEISPSRVKTVNSYELEIISPDGEYIGEPALDIWDSQHEIGAPISFKEKGNYAYVLEYEGETSALAFAMEIGIVLEKKN
jgi:gliding motility-associated lipoprotein GldH